MELSSEKKKDLFYAMLRIRRVEKRIETLYLEDEIKTPMVKEGVVKKYGVSLSK